MFRWLATLLLMCLLQAGSATANNFPTAAQVEADARAAVTNGRVTRVEIDGGWKLERESGYTFANLAKQAIVAEKQNTDGTRQQFNALAIYQRGAAGDPWVFDRLFSYGWKSLDGASASAAMDAATLHALTLKAMRENPGGWMPVDPRNVYRVDAFAVVPGSIREVSDSELVWEIEGEFIVDDTTQSTDPGVKKLRQRIKVEGVQHAQTREWILSKAAEVSSTNLGRQALTREQKASLPTLADAPFDQLYFGDK
ncbi:MAG: hypothetical protein IT479_13645 [Xanthomonadales bacterium]|nr:hypothetical protein [Xanthomonadales bacterium]MCC6594302.1 hypothetical protein [Xanthomonadales bacterium]